ncbi:MAG TPA: aminotransferase class I/II-fold pyridoxal phosphate-dependent enzyme [Pirellulales bacterium]|jgi:cystathionine beta-lyase/cystathionine gamma-synthase|nr:aminotransferase class I/II-fold pyridoxal phosphate-dependent enzyme [Pirellulales bacterium]
MKKHKPDDICPRPEFLPPQPTQPAAAPLYTASVYRCDSPDQASKLLAGELPGYVYSRDGHPNADLLAEKCRELHGAERAAICGSGMAALAAAVLSQAAQGDHLLVSNQLYGRSIQLLSAEAARLGVDSTLVDACDLEAVEAALRPNTRLLVVETIANPLLRVADLEALAALTAKRGALLLVDNTFASPAVCRPLEFGADLVLESLTKIMSGHSDVLLGLLCGWEQCWQRVPLVLSAWGLSSSPFDCWMASRGLGTMALRVERAATNAMAAARFLEQRPDVESVSFPGLAAHPDHSLAVRQFGNRFGTVVTFCLRGGQAAADAFIASARRIPFCPSLGDLNTTLSHPASTSHRLLSPEARAAQGIRESTIRLSVGIEAEESVLDALGEALDGMQTRLGLAR